MSEEENGTAEKMTDEEYPQYLKQCGFDDIEIVEKIAERDMMRKLMGKSLMEQREIVSSTYLSAIRRTEKDINIFLCRKGNENA